MSHAKKILWRLAKCVIENQALDVNLTCFLCIKIMTFNFKEFCWSRDVLVAVFTLHDLQFAWGGTIFIAEALSQPPCSSGRN